MQCPKCLGTFEPIVFNDVVVDRCINCKGLFFDHLERETLKKMEGAQLIDDGDEYVGARYNEILDVPCPKCKTKMEAVIHNEPFEIKFEHCPSCKGNFFDAGEFRDYLDDEIFSQFQDVIDELD